MNMLKRFTSNASANVLGGFVTAVYNLVLPSIVVKNISHSDFSIWSLGIQVIIYLQVLGFGIQIAIARFISVDNESNNQIGLGLTMVAGKKLVMRLAFFATLITFFLVYIYPFFFINLSSDSVSTLRCCVFFFGISASIQLLSLSYIGFYTGIHKNYVHIGCQTLGRIFSILLVYFVCNLTNDIRLLSLGLSIGLLIPLILLYLVTREKIQVSVSVSKIDLILKQKEIFSYCKVLAIWSICMLFVNGIQSSIVGFFDVSQVGSYSLALTLVMIMVGLQQAVLSPIITAGSVLHSNNNNIKLLSLFKISTFLCVLILLTSVVLVYFFGKWFVGVWVGSVYQNSVFHILLTLIVANAIRNILSPYSMLLIAVGAHKIAHIPAIIEATVSLLLMILLGWIYGVTGVANATIIAAVSGVLANALITFKKVSFLDEYRMKALVVYALTPVVIILAIYFFMISMS